MVVVRGFARTLSRANILLCILFVMLGASASAAPYCLLRKPFSPPQGNCFQFYLADAAVAAPSTMAVVDAAGCTVTDYAARQGWLPDETVPGPHATSGEGDSAMAVVSPYFGDAYGCRAPTDGNTSGPGGPGGGTGCTEVQTVNQPEQRDASGAITVEASIIHVMNCPGNRQVYLYEYLNRTAFRVINPPNWSRPVGGRDFGSSDEALSVAATGQPPADLTGGTGEGEDGSGAAQAQDANFTWMWQFRAFTFNGQFSGSTKTGWAFSGDAVQGVVASVSCKGGPADLSEFGIEAGGGGRMECTAQFPPAGGAGGATWHGTGQGRIDWDGFILKAGGKGVRIDDSGTTEDSIEVFHLRAGHVPPA